MRTPAKPIALAITLALAAPTAAAAHHNTGGHKLRTYRDEHGHTRQVLDGDHPVKPAAVANGPNALMDTYDDVTPLQPTCVAGSNTTTKRVTVVVAWPYDSPGGTAGDVTTVRNQMGLLSGKMWATQRRRPKLECNENSGPTYTWPIGVFGLPVSSCSSAMVCPFTNIANAIRSSAISNLQFIRKFLVFYKGAYPGICGQAEVRPDTRSTQDNDNNGGTYGHAGDDMLTAVVYDTQSYDPTPPNTGNRSCWQTGANLHEMLHTLGAVQQTAPHATVGFHCNDGIDIMCYNDGTQGGELYSETYCPSTVEIDCGRDTYFGGTGAFDPLPHAGPWLQTHWNLNSSAFISSTRPV